MKINGDLQFAPIGSELQNVLIERLAADPVSTEQGHLYYNTVVNEFRYYNPSGGSPSLGWISIVAGGRLEDLADVTASTGSPATDSAGDVLVYNTSTGNYESRQIQYIYDSRTGSPATVASHTITHNLDQMYVTVTAYDITGSPEVVSQIIPATVTLTSANITTVTFISPVECIVVITGVSGVVGAF